MAEQEQEQMINEIPQTYINNDEKEKGEIKNIVVFEFLGTLLFIYGALASDGNNFGVCLVYFVSLIFCGRLSGGHFNPIITLIGYIDSTVTKKKCFYYIGAQFAAALVSGMILLPILNLQKAPYYENFPANQMFGTIVAELGGSMIFFTFVQIQTLEQTRLTSTKFQGALFLAIIFFIAQEYTTTTDNSLFNPAAAFGLTIFYGIYYGKWNQLINLLVYMVGPWIGSLTAITFFWKVYYVTLAKKQE